MALSSTFHHRLQQLEDARNHRVALLQAEKELQAKKAQLLSEKLANLRRVEQRCLLLERRQAEIAFQILANKSEIDDLEARSHAVARVFRDLWGQIAELEGRKKERDEFYEKKIVEMGEFKEQVRRCFLHTRAEVETSRNLVSELKSNLADLQKKGNDQSSVEITQAEQRKAELLASLQTLDKNLASNYRIKQLLQKQLQKTLLSQTRSSNSKAAGKDDAAKETEPAAENFEDRFRLL